MENPEGPSATPAPELPQDKKLRMETEKLRAEIEAIRKPFYNTTSFYVSVSPVVLAVIGVLFTWASGWFGTQRKSIDADKKLLLVETKELEKQKEEQKSYIRELTNRVGQLRFLLYETDTQLGQLLREKITLTNLISGVCVLSQIGASSFRLIIIASSFHTVSRPVIAD